MTQNGISTFTIYLWYFWEKQGQSWRDRWPRQNLINLRHLLCSNNIKPEKLKQKVSHCHIVINTERDLSAASIVSPTRWEFTLIVVDKMIISQRCNENTSWNILHYDVRYKQLIDCVCVLHSGRRMTRLTWEVVVQVPWEVVCGFRHRVVWWLCRFQVLTFIVVDVTAVIWLQMNMWAWKHLILWRELWQKDSLKVDWRNGELEEKQWSSPKHSTHIPKGSTITFSFDYKTVYSSEHVIGQSSQV